MCDQLTILIEDDLDHYVGYCTHGTVQVAWGHLSLSLRRNDFVSLVDSAVHACLQAGAPPDGHAAAFRLHVDDVLLYLETESFWKFTDLMRRAVEQMPQAMRRKIKEGAVWRIEMISNRYKAPKQISLN